MKHLRILKYMGFGILGVAAIALFILLTMSLWNCLIPSLFHGPVLSYWQTAGLFILSKILLTGVAPGGHGHDQGRRWHSKYNERYNRRCREEAPDAEPQKA